MASLVAEYNRKELLFIHGIKSGRGSPLRFVNWRKPRTENRQTCVFNTHFDHCVYLHLAERPVQVYVMKLVVVS
jgi:hypothetical protein